jgi:hypothetical protein
MREEIAENNGSESLEAEMTFLEHLEELRWRLIYSLIGVVVGTIICFVFIEFLVDAVLLRPRQKFRCFTAEPETFRSDFPLFPGCSDRRHCT